MMSEKEIKEFLKQEEAELEQVRNKFVEKDFNRKISHKIFNDESTSKLEVEKCMWEGFCAERYSRVKILRKVLGIEEQ